MDRRICFLLAAFIVGAASENALAVSKYTGRHFYFALMGSSHRNSIFAKEFAEGTGVPTIGGSDELALPDEDAAVGVRAGFEKINSKRAGLGMSVTYWHVQFDDISFLYDRDGSRSFIAGYGEPRHDLLFLDVNGVFLAWDSGWQALGLYGLVSLVADRQEYRIDKYSTEGVLSQRDGLVSRQETSTDARFGFGVGIRVHLARRLSLWLEKRWIVGESFSRPVAPDAGGATGEAGALTGERQETLYAPISSVGLAAHF